MTRTFVCKACGGTFPTPGASGRRPDRCDDCNPYSTANRQNRARVARRRIFDGLSQSPRGRLYADVLLEVVRLNIDGANRADLRAAVVRVAHAEGPRALRSALIRLIAVALAYASTVPIAPWEEPRR